MGKCRKCQQEVSEQASVCPGCGASFPAAKKRKYRGFEYKSRATILGIPLLHISFKYRPNWVPLPAKGIISIGQFGMGIVNISQFGIGIISLSQVTLAFYALAQVALAFSLIAQVGVYVHQGRGPIVTSVAEVFRFSPGIEELETVDSTPLPGDGWKVSTPEGEGLDPMLVAALYYDAARLPRLYGLLIVKNGRLVAEKYFNEGSVDQKALMQSVTKSYTSALVGIALEQGHLSSLDQKMMDFFPELNARITDPRKNRITIREMLQMRAGYPWEESDPAYWKALLSGSYLPLVADIPLVSDPGTEFNYSNLTSHWLGVIVARACDTDLKSYAQENLFEPIGAEVGDWIWDRDGYYMGFGEMHFTARDAARFGLLYLNEGEFEGKQLVPAGWVRESLGTYSENVTTGGPRSGRVGRYFHNIGYGYQWWSAGVDEYRFNYAVGHGGQMIVLLDEFDMVLVVTSDPFYQQHDGEAWKHEKANYDLVGKFIRSLPKE
jgi:CubicO group peptidase (beta-lactamase class C family)